MKNFFELTPRFDSRASFYGKAHVIINDDDSLTLRSYDTDILTIDTTARTIIKLWDDWSQTTGRHIIEFAKQYHLPIANKRAFEVLPVNMEISY